MAPPSYLSAAANPSSDDDGSSASLRSDSSSSSSHDGPQRSKSGLCGRCHASVLCLGRVVGLGNLIRFPYLTYKHGGGAFLIAYFLILTICGLPLVILETAIGQYSSLGPIRVWRAVPIFKGVGYSMVAISAVTSIYYGVISSWAMLYLVTSMTSVTPWENCSNMWNTNSCITIELSVNTSCKRLNASSLEDNTNNSSDFLVSIGGLVGNAERGQEDVLCDGYCNCTGPGLAGHIDALSSSVSEYFYRSVVEASEDWDEPRDLSWQLSLCLVAAWTLVTVALIKGVKPGERTTYFTLGLTLVTLLVLFVRASSLLGGHDGLSFLFTPQWSFLTRGQLWRDAATQVFFSLSLGSGTLVAIGTCNKFNNNLFSEAALICSMDSLVSVFSSLVVFAVLGSFSHYTGQPMEKVARADLGLSFVALSHATLHLPGHLFWSALTFLTLVMCGVFTCTSLAATAVTSLVEVFSAQLKKQRVWLVLGLCAAAVLLGLTMMVQAGFNLVDVLDRYLSGLPELFTSGLLLSAFAWVYGVNRFSGDVSRMVNSQVSWWWRLLWGCVCPCLLLIFIIISLTSLLSEEIDPTVASPWFTKLIGILPLVSLLTPIVVCACHEVSQSRSKILMEKIRRACQTRREWGATEHRCSSHVEYFPTVHTHMGIDISLDGLNTITDRVEFSTVGVRVPSLSQTSLLPVSPSMRKASRGSKGGKVRDMRHTAILNHAYSNPQCNLSSGSLEKPEKRKRPAAPAEISKTDDVIFVRRKRKKVPTTDASTQTERRWHEPTLFRQRSQPSVRVTPPVPSQNNTITRSISWHQLGKPAVLHVDALHLVNGIFKEETSDKDLDSTNAKIDIASGNWRSKGSDDNFLPDHGVHGRKKRNKTRTNVIKGENRNGADSLAYLSDKLQGIKINSNKSLAKAFNRSFSCDDSNFQNSNSNNIIDTGNPKPGKVKGGARNTGTEKRRRCGQSVAPNPSMLVRQNSLPHGQPCKPAEETRKWDDNSIVLESPAKFATRSHSARFKNGADSARQKSSNVNRASSLEHGRLTCSGKKRADTVVRLSNSKNNSPEVCALSLVKSDVGIAPKGKTKTQFPGSVAVQSFVANTRSRTGSPYLNKITFTECAANSPGSTLQRSRSIAGGRRGTTVEKSSMRPVVSQPAIGGASSQRYNDETKGSSGSLFYAKLKPRSKSVDEYTTSEQRCLHYRSIGSLPTCGIATKDSSLHESDLLRSEQSNSLLSENEGAMSLSIKHSSKDDRRTRNRSSSSSFPNFQKEMFISTEHEAPERQFSRCVESQTIGACEGVYADSDPASVSVTKEIYTTENLSATCCGEEDSVILEETEVDLEFDKEEHKRLVPSPSSSLPSPSSSLLPHFDDAV